MSFLGQTSNLPDSSHRDNVDSPPPPPPPPPPTPSNTPSPETQYQSIFQYEGLGVGEIRLITILSGTGDQPILCSLSTHILTSTAGRYETLSYTWGGAVEKELIYLDNGSSYLHITANCAAAIRRLRLPDQIRVLWIDAICINQADTLERNSQVSIMANIYKSAFQVLVYVGEADRTSDRAMEFLLKVEKREIAFNEKLTLDDHEALKALLNRPWFSRVWVLQEIYMSRKAFLVCGSYAVSWHNIQILRGFDRLGSLSLGRWPFVTTIKDRATFSIPGHLFTILTESRDCQATDPRDKVFALLSLFHDAAKYHLRADYREELAPILHRTAMRLAGYKSLHFLSAIQTGSEVAGLPSWVPDWTAPMIRAPLFPFQGIPRKFDAGPSRMEGRGQQNAAWEISGLFTTRFPQKSEDSLAQHLHVFGPCLGRINLLLEIIDLDNMQWTDILDHCNQVAMSVLRKFAERDIPSSSDLTSGQAAQSLLHCMVAEIHHPRRPDLMLEPNLNLFDSIFDTKNEDLAWGERIKKVMNNRRFFATTRGLVGFAPAEAEIGDTVYILASGPVPYILREAQCNHVESTSASAERPLTYRFIGEIYGAGVMRCDEPTPYSPVSYSDLIIC